MREKLNEYGRLYQIRRVGREAKKKCEGEKKKFGSTIFFFLGEKKCGI
jgi:hypothetical protein